MRNVIFLIILFVLTACNGQNIKDNNKKISNNRNIQQMENNDGKMIVKKFDIKSFNANNKYGKYEFTTADGIEVIQYEITTSDSEKTIGYYENRAYINSPYKYYNEYDILGNLIISNISFYNINTGIGKWYDLSGNIVKTKNFDADYPFSINMLIEKMKNEHDIDIMDAENCKRISRAIYKEYYNTPLYSIWIETNSTGLNICYLINGNTGETLFTTTRFPEEKKGSLFDEYMESLEQ